MRSFYHIETDFYFLRSHSKLWTRTTWCQRQTKGVGMSGGMGMSRGGGVCPGGVKMGVGIPWDLGYHQYWHLVATTKRRTVGKRTVRILLKCFLVHWCFLTFLASILFSFSNSTILVLFSETVFCFISSSCFCNLWFSNSRRSIFVLEVSFSWSDKELERPANNKLISIHQNIFIFMSSQKHNLGKFIYAQNNIHRVTVKYLAAAIWPS